MSYKSTYSLFLELPTIICKFVERPLASRQPLNVSARCIAMDSIIRVVGALSLWAIEIVMQMRIYALYRCSRKVDILASHN